jgi:uncharacterized protein (TIGR02996 family)
VTLTTTIAAMLRAVRESPDDDTLRLALADALADTDASEGGDADWAEFIRAQVWLGRPIFRDASCVVCGASTVRGNTSTCGLPCSQCADRWDELRHRSDALLDAHQSRWRRGPACERCAWSGRVNSDKPFRYTEPCPDCRGSGWTGPLGERGGRTYIDGRPVEADKDWLHPAEFRRGFIHKVSTPLADVFRGDDVTEWAKRVARWPCVCLEEWGLTDREPANRTAINGKWYWFRLDPLRDEFDIILGFSNARLPDVIFDELAGGQKDTTGLPFDTEAAARLALAKAVAAVVNEAAHD